MRAAVLALALALAWTAPADAGLRATYRIADEETPLVVDVADNGDTSFAQPGGDVRLAVIGGHAFVIGEFDDGLQTVRLTDLTRALQKTGTPALELDEPLPKDMALLDRIVTTPAGKRSVAGIAGTVYRLTAGKGVKIEGGDEVVATSAPALQPIGAALNIAVAEGGGVLILFDEAGPAVARIIRLFTRLVALGTPLEWKGLYALTALETRRIPPETIALPGAPIAPDALILRIRALAPGA